MTAAAMIKHNMEVLGCDGVHIGIVDDLEATGVVKLAKDDPEAGGEDRFIPLDWVVHVEMKVHLKQPGAQIKAQWQAH